MFCCEQSETSSRSKTQLHYLPRTAIIFEQKIMFQEKKIVKKREKKTRGWLVLLQLSIDKVFFSTNADVIENFRAETADK